MVTSKPPLALWSSGILLDGFWEEYRAYRDAGVRERQQVLLPGGGVIEIYYSMSSVRASFRPDVPPFDDSNTWEKAVVAMAAEREFLTDFRDDSYVLTNLEGAYYARLRFSEFLFTPERFEDEPGLLEELVTLYRSTDLPSD